MPETEREKELESVSEIELDDIVVLLTETSRRAGGAIGVLAVDGPTALARLKKAFKPNGGKAAKPGEMVLGRIVNGRGEPVDEVLVAITAAADSRTGQPCGEICAHGGPMSVEAVLAALLDAGYRSDAEAELHRRSVRAGRTALIELECRLAAARCRTERQAAYVLRNAPRLQDAARVIVNNLAHAARGFQPSHNLEGLPELTGLDNLWFDTSANCEPMAHQAIIRIIGHDKLMYGTDLPVSHGRGRSVRQLPGEDPDHEGWHPGCRRVQVFARLHLHRGGCDGQQRGPHLQR